MTPRTRLLIVDDSRLFRAALEEALADVGDLHVIGSVWSGTRALEFLHADPPDVVTLDVEMPGLSGLDTLRAIQHFNAARPAQPPIGVIMVSAYTQAGAQVTLEALTAGAFDFVTKPAGSDADSNVQVLRLELIAKIHQFMRHRRPPTAHAPLTLPVLNLPTVARRRRLLRAILIAVSTGGPRALSTLLPDLCRRVDVPIFVVQHLPPAFTASLAGLLDRQCSHRVKEATEGELVLPRTVYVAPGGKHLLLRRLAGGEVATGLTEQPPENGCRPSADVLFRSAAGVYGGEVAAVVLTGMGCDGSAGLGPLHRAGAHVFAQDEATSVVWGMPGSAVATGCVDEVLPLDRLAAALQTLVPASRLHQPPEDSAR